MDMQNQQKVEASKQFSVSVERLFQAWNDPEQLKQWWKPMGNQLNQVTNDLKPGGTVSYTFADNTLIISGKYEEVKENEQLVYTWNWDFPGNPVKNANYKLNVRFSASDNGSEIYVVQENNGNEENMHPNDEGWDQGLSDLDAFLTSHQEGSEGLSATTDGSGYQELPDQLKVAGG